MVLMRQGNNNKDLRVALVALVMLAFYSQASRVCAQGGRDSTGTGGIHTIQGRVFFPSGRSSGEQVKVELETSERGNLSTLTGPDGAFRFSNLLAGSYAIVVTGSSEFEVVREPVYIERDKMSRTVTVPIYFRYKRSGTAAKAGVIDASLAGVPKQALEQYEKGLEAAQSADSDKSIEHFKNAIAIYQDFGHAFNELGVQYLKIGQAEKAAQALQEAVRLSPDSPLRRLNYGVALLNKNDFEGARQQLTESIKKNDVSATAHMYLGIALVRLKKLDEAEAELGRAVALGKNDIGMAHKYLGGIYWSRREYKRAAEELEKYLQLAPNAPDAERIRGSIKELKTKK